MLIHKTIYERAWKHVHASCVAVHRQAFSRVGVHAQGARVRANKVQASIEQASEPARDVACWTGSSAVLTCMQARVIKRVRKQAHVDAKGDLILPARC